LSLLKEKGKGRREKGEGRREKGRREKGEGRRELSFSLDTTLQEPSPPPRRHIAQASRVQRIAATRHGAVGGIGHDLDLDTPEVIRTLHGDYRLNLGNTRVVLLADVFNLFNTHTVTEYDDYTESTFGVENPDFGRRLAFQNPLAVRFGFRFEF
jgi:hypothetical protein